MLETFPKQKGSSYANNEQREYPQKSSTPTRSYIPIILPKKNFQINSKPLTAKSQSRHQNQASLSNLQLVLLDTNPTINSPEHSNNALTLRSRTYGVAPPTPNQIKQNMYQQTVYRNGQKERAKISSLSFRQLAQNRVRKEKLIELQIKAENFERIRMVQEYDEIERKNFQRKKNIKNIFSVNPQISNLFTKNCEDYMKIPIKAQNYINIDNVNPMVESVDLYDLFEPIDKGDGQKLPGEDNNAGESPGEDNNAGESPGEENNAGELPKGENDDAELILIKDEQKGEVDLEDDDNNETVEIRNDCKKIDMMLDNVNRKVSLYKFGDGNNLHNQKNCSNLNRPITIASDNIFASSGINTDHSHYISNNAYYKKKDHGFSKSISLKEFKLGNSLEKMRTTRERILHSQMLKDRAGHKKHENSEINEHLSSNMKINSIDFSTYNKAKKYEQDFSQYYSGANIKQNFSHPLANKDSTIEKTNFSGEGVGGGDSNRISTKNSKAYAKMGNFFWSGGNERKEFNDKLKKNMGNLDLQKGGGGGSVMNGKVNMCGTVKLGLSNNMSNRN